MSSELTIGRRFIRVLQRSSPQLGGADAICVLRATLHLRRPGAIIITAVAATDLLYRLLVRESVRRALGMSD